MGGTHIGLGGHLHTDESGQTGTKGTHHKGNAYHGGRGLGRAGNCQQNRNAGHENGENLVFSLEERHRAFGNVAGDFAHFGIARVLSCDPR